MPVPFVPLVEVLRGGIVESVHYGAVAVVDRAGRLLFAAGDPEVVTYTRSSLKPLQALPFVAAGGVERYKLTTQETALLCASHSGEARHVEAAASILAKAGNDASDLQCGTHPPVHYEVRGEIPPPPPYSPLSHNCSGKHSGMLAHCAACGYGKHDYLAIEHPLQREIRAAVAAMTGVPEDALHAGIDGCSAPNYAMPLARLALAFARLASADVDPPMVGRPGTLADAMTTAPEMVSGEGRSDLALSRAGRGDWVCKIGAEGGTGDRHPQPRLGHRDQGRRRRPPRVAARRRSPRSSKRGWSMRRRATSWRRSPPPRCATIAGLPSGRSGLSLSWTKRTDVLTPVAKPPTE